MTGIKAVIFDLYKTLVDLPVDTTPYARLIRDVGLVSDEQFARARRIAIGQNFDDLAVLLEKLCPEAQIDLAAYEKSIHDEIAQARLYPETVVVLEKLRIQGLAIGIISNVATPYKKKFYEFGLGAYVDEVILSCDHGLVKPDPAIYMMMAKRLDISPSTALMTGDQIEKDVLGPKAVGMHAVHLDRKGKTPGSIATLEGVFDYL